MKRFDVRVDKRLCKKCGICVAFCPKNVFSLSNELKVDAERCNGCKRCEVYCPDFAIDVKAVKEARHAKRAERAVAGK